MRTLTFGVYAFFLALNTISGQDTLQINQAIELGLSKHFGLQIAEHAKQIAENNATRGSVGMLPEVNLTSALGLSNTNINQRFASGQEQSRNFASSANGGVGVALNWTIFDGKRMQRTLERLESQVVLSDYELQLQAELLTAYILTNCAEGIRQQQLISATRKSLDFYNERIRLATVRFENGVSGKNALLQTTVDKNVQESLLLQAETALQLLKIELNGLLLRSEQTVFAYPSNFGITENLQLDTLLSLALNSNRQLRIEQQRALVAEKFIAETEALYKPRIGFNAAYNYNLARNQAGFLLYNQNYGLNTGLNLQWNLYNGHQTKRLVENAKLQASSADLYVQQMTQNLKTDMYLAYAQWQSARTIAQNEEKNAQLYTQNLEINQERFRISGADILMVKEAQKSFEDAQMRIINARYQAKISEIALFRLCGSLSKENLGPR